MILLYLLKKINHIDKFEKQLNSKNLGFNNE